jgi:hypothetical protein
MTTWYEKNKDKQKEYSKKYREEHKEEYLAKARKRTAQWRLDNPGKDKILHAEWRKKNPKKHMIARSKSMAKFRGIEFTITEEDIEIPTHCPILGIELKQAKGYSDGSASLDRVDNNKGYIPGNVKVISQRANILKSSGTAEEHLKIAEYILSHIGC